MLSGYSDRKNCAHIRANDANELENSTISTIQQYAEIYRTTTSQLYGNKSDDCSTARVYRLSYFDVSPAFASRSETVSRRDVDVVPRFSTTKWRQHDVVPLFSTSKRRLFDKASFFPTGLLPVESDIIGQKLFSIRHLRKIRCQGDLRASRLNFSLIRRNSVGWLRGRRQHRPQDELHQGEAIRRCYGLGCWYGRFQRPLRAREPSDDRYLQRPEGLHSTAQAAKHHPQGKMWTCSSVKYPGCGDDCAKELKNRRRRTECHRNLRRTEHWPVCEPNRWCQRAD